MRFFIYKHTTLISKMGSFANEVAKDYYLKYLTRFKASFFNLRLKKEVGGVVIFYPRLRHWAEI